MSYHIHMRMQLDNWSSNKIKAKWCSQVIIRWNNTLLFFELQTFLHSDSFLFFFVCLFVCLFVSLFVFCVCVNHDNSGFQFE